MSRRGSLIYQAENELKSKIAYGDSRHNDKISDRKNGTNITGVKIYSINTFLTYLKQVSFFSKICESTVPEMQNDTGSPSLRG